MTYGEIVENATEEERSRWYVAEAFRNVDKNTGSEGISERFVRPICAI